MSTEYEPQGAAAAAHYIPEYFTRMGEGEMGPNAAGETGLPNPLLLPHDSALEAELNEALAAYEESAKLVAFSVAPRQPFFSDKVTVFFL